MSAAERRRLLEALGNFAEHLHPRNRKGEWSKKLGGAINFHGSGDTAILRGPKKTYGAVAKLKSGKFGAEHGGAHLGEHDSFDAAAEAVAKHHVEKHGEAPEEKIPGATAIVKGKAGRFVKLNGKQVHVPHHDDFSRKLGDDTFTSPAGTTAVYKNDAPYNAPKGIAQPGNAAPFPKKAAKADLKDNPTDGSQKAGSSGAEKWQAQMDAGDEGFAAYAAKKAAALGHGKGKLPSSPGEKHPDWADGKGGPVKPFTASEKQGAAAKVGGILAKETLKSDILSRLEEKGGTYHTGALKYDTGGHAGSAGVSKAWDEAAKSLEDEGKVTKMTNPLGEHYVLAGKGGAGSSPIPNYDGVTLSGASAAGGSTGAQITQGSDGKKYLVKTYGGDQDRVATELAANAIYRALGVKVPEAGSKDNGGKPALAYPLLDGSPTKIKAPSEEIGKHFMADALVANWDFIGLTDDNILWDKDGKPFRVDQGGTLQYRAQGQKKTFGPIPGEVETMMTGGGQGVGKVKVSEEQKKEQAAQIAKTLTPDKIDAIMQAAPFADEKMRGEVTDALKGRVAWMAKYASGDKTAAQALASAASEQSKPSTPEGVAKGSPADLTAALQKELQKASASFPGAKSFGPPGTTNQPSYEKSAPKGGGSKMNSPARSPSGNLRNFKSMGDSKLAGVWSDIVSHNSSADDPDNEAQDAIASEMKKRGLPMTGGSAANTLAKAPQASAAATVKPPPPAAISGSKTLKPELNSPGRGPTGALRNFQQMGDSKLAKTLLDLVGHGNDPEALQAAQAEAIKRRPNVKLKEALHMADGELARQRRVRRRLELFEAADSLAKASTPEPFSTSKTSNWVARGGGLPAYIQHVAHGLVERGKSESQAIQMAIGIVKRWARGGGNVDAGTRAAAAKAVAEWDELKAKNKAKSAD